MSQTLFKLGKVMFSLALAGFFGVLTGLLDLNHTAPIVYAQGNTCFVEASGDNSTDYSSSDASAVQDAVTAATAGDTLKIAGTCAGVQTVSGQIQTVYINKQITLIGGYTNGNWTATPDPVANPTVLDANSGGRVLYITTNGDATVENLILQNGSSAFGGAIFHLGPLTLHQSQIQNSTAPVGGGIYSSGSVLTVTQSSLISNTAGSSGGGIYNDNTVTTIENSTFSNNQVTGSGGDGGGAIYAVGNNTPTTIRYSTFSGNGSASSGGALRGDGNVTLLATIIANSTSGGDCAFPVSQQPIDGGYNLIEDGSCLSASTSQSGDPALGNLADNGGATPTHALNPTSPALDQIPFDTQGCGTSTYLDQRGSTRPYRTHCDIGAYELDNNFPPVAVNDTYTLTEDSILTVSLPISGLLANDSDPELNALTAVLDSLPQNGTLTTMVSNWQIEAVDTAGNVGWDTSIAKIGGHPAISYRDATNADLKYARYDGTSWQIETIDTTGSVGWYTSLAEINGQPAISYYDATQDDLKYARYNGTSWQIEAVDTTGNVGEYTSLAEINGQPAISYRDATNSNLKVARYDGANWQIEAIDTTGNVDSDTSLAEIGGQPAISYRDATNGNLKVARYDGTSWQIEMVDSAGNVGVYSSLAEIGGQPAISYYDASNGNLKVARYDGASWQIEAVDTVGNVGLHTSLAEIGAQPAISYRDATNGDLKVARYDGTSWQIEAVDTVGDVGYDTSLAEINGQPAISYYADSNSELKYAILGNNGTFTYTPDLNFCGTDSFTYHAHDGLFDSNVATVTLTVSCVNDPPVAVNDAYTLTEDSTLTVTLPISGLLANDSDPDLDTLIAVTDSIPLNGTLTLLSAWQVEAVDTAGLVGQHTSIAAIGGQPAISYYDLTNKDLKYAQYDGTTWQIEAVDTVGRVGEYSSLLEIGGQPAISYYDLTNGDLKYARYDGASWQIEAVDTADVVGSYSSLALIGGQPAISYYDGTNDDLKYARYDGTAWQIEVIDTPGDVGASSSLVEIGGQPAISYFDYTNGDLKYARYDGTTWQTEAVDTVGDVGYDTSLALIGGQPAISYYDLTNGDLKYAHYDGASWQIEAADTVGVVGQHSSLVEIGGQPFISYYDWDTEDLKMATLVNEGAFTYTPNPDFCGADSFTYHANDGALDSNIATVTLNVSCVNDPPLAVTDSYTTSQNNLLVISAPGLLDNDSDVDGDTLFVSLKTNPVNGTVALDVDGSFVYTPTLGFNGSDSFSYILSDGVLTDTAVVTLTIVPDLDLSATDPSHQALNVSASQVISLSFDTTVDPSTVSSQTIGLYGTMGGYSWDYDASGNTVLITPTTPFFPGEVVRLAVSAGVQNQPGGSAVPEQIQFTAAATAPQSCTAAFTAIDPNLPAVDVSAVAWGDYDNDGDLDILLSGSTGSDTRTTQIYRNESGSFVHTGISLPGFEKGSADWGDYDNDGDLDILLSGATGLGNDALIYRNNNGSFTSVTANLDGVSLSDAAWGDYDNDGDLDILLSGDGSSGPATQVYRNGNGSFTDINAGLTGTVYSAVDWGDYDNDGDLDILLSGWAASVFVTQIYRNDDGIFTNINAGLAGAAGGSVAWGDYDNDGDLDILLTGWTLSAGVVRVYRNKDGAFSDVTAGLTDIRVSAAAWGDYDGDGDLDILLSGDDSSGPVTQVYRNDAGSFTDINAGLIGADFGDVAWGDYDNDGDLDILLTGSNGSGRVTQIYRNDHICTLNLTQSGTGNGSVTLDPNQSSYAYGTVITLTATPGLGSAFVDWTGDANGSTSPITVTMDNHKSITATFDTLSGMNCWVSVNDSGVTNYASADALAVQTAVNAANPGDTLKIAGTCAGVQTIATYTQTVYIDRSLTLQGGYTTTNWLATPDPVAYPTTLDAQDSGRVVYANTTSPVTLAGLNLTGGNGLVGGAGTTDGGAIYLRTNGRLDFDHAVIYNNHAYNGGGLYTASSWVTATHSTLISNTAGYRGGALNGQGNTVFTLIASQVLSNTAAGGGGIAAGHNTNTTLMDSVVAYNNSTGSGGGIHNLADTVTIDHSAIYHNSATNLGGAIYNGSGGVADVINSTLSSNTANSGGSAIFQSYGLTTTLVNATVANNGGNNGPLRFSGGALVISNTIVANSGSNCAFTNGGTLTSGGYNLEDGDTCTLTATTDITNTPALLGPLADNGGATRTHALLTGSPALDAIPAGNCTVSTDQRGTGRPQATGCDMGAYEAVQQTLAVTLSGTGSGAVNSDPAGIDCGTACTAGFPESTVVTLTATADTGFTFTGWSGACTGLGDCVVAVNATRSVTASFTLEQYALTTTTDGNGSGTVTADPDQTPYDYGTVITLTALANTGSAFAGWSGDASGSTNPITVTITGDAAITAAFHLLTYTLSANSSGDGSITIDPQQSSYDYGTVVTLTATANTGSSFAGWSGDATGATNPITVTITGDAAITATFDLLTYTLTVIEAGNGSGDVSLDPAGGTYGYGTVVTLTATPDIGNSFDGWTGDVTKTSEVITVTMTGDVGLFAAFTLQTFTLTVTEDGNGSGNVLLAPSGDSYDYGAVVTLTASANTGSAFAGWSGDASGSTNPITVTITGDKSITATFDLLTYTLTTYTSGDGSITIDPDQPSYDYGVVVTLTASPDIGWQFDSWSGNAFGTVTKTTVAMTGDKVVTATFTRPPAGVTVAPTTVAASELGATEDYTVRLDSQPTGPVTIIITPDAQTTVSVSQLIFTPANWDAPQTVTVGAVNDTVAEGQHSGAIVHSATSNDSNYNGITVEGVTVSISDDDSPCLCLTPINITVSEDGTTDQYAMRLTTQPSAVVTVTLNITSSDLSATPTQLVFTPLTWSNLQTVTVSAVDNDSVDGPRTFIIDHQTESADSDYTSLPPREVTVTALDNDSAGVTVAPTSVNATEGGLGDDYSVVLTSEPSADVTVTINSDAQTSVSPTQLTFTAANWDSPQSVSVGAVDDALIEGNHSGTISHIASSSDADYNGLAVSGVTVNISDNDSAGVAVNPATLNLSEGSAAGSYSVVLTSQPAADVTITIGSDAQLSVSPTQLTFTAANWDSPQSVSVGAVDDAVAEGSHGGTISHTASSSDADYNGLTVSGVTVNISDNDSAGVTVAPTAVSASELGATEDYTVQLNSQPTDPVTVTVSHFGQTTVSVNQLLFTPANWNAPQSVTVGAVDDTVAEGQHSGAIMHAVASNDSNYNGITVAGVTVTISDDDSPCLCLNPINVSVSEAGTTDQYAMRLTTQPSAVVTVTLDITSSDISATPTQLVFTPLTWSSLQTVTVSALDNNQVDGTRRVIIDHQTASADSDYASLPPREVTVTILDDDSLPVYTLNLGTTGAGSGSVSVEPNQNSFTAGTVVTLTATANPGSNFAGWSGSISSADNPLVLTMDGDKSISAAFSTTPPVTYSLTVNTVGQGSVTPGTSTQISGSTPSLSATPASGWLFSGWSGDLSGSANPADLLMDADKVVTATFTLDTNPPTAPGLSGPANGVITTTQRPTFNWTAATDAETSVVSYTLLITDSSGSVLVIPTTTTTYTPPSNLAYGVYTWTVQAHDAAGNASGYASPPLSFTIEAAGTKIYLPFVVKN